MKEDFFKWMTDKKSFLSKYGIDTEKLTYKEESKNDYSCVIVHHYNPNKCLGHIEMFGVNMVFFEVIDFNSGERLAIEHTEFDYENDFNVLFESYFTALISGEKVD
ncbi:hypothetical protein WAK64_13405 [Bacillus spongiae]|uniref:Phage protein n=1 Tax=Bacillus spongiae TaxID=2683610 RepID=A0ABU8HFU8_9BACI